MGSKLTASILVSLMLASVLPIMLTSTPSTPPASAPTPQTMAFSPGLENILTGDDTVHSTNTWDPAPWTDYPVGSNPPTIAANELGGGRIVAAGISWSLRDGYIDDTTIKPMMVAIFQWLSNDKEKASTKILWYEGYGVFYQNNKGGSTKLVTYLISQGYEDGNIVADGTEPISDIDLSTYDILFLPQLELGVDGTGGDPDLLPEGDLEAIRDFVEVSGKGLLVVEACDYGTSNSHSYYKVQNRILSYLDFGMYFQPDQLKKGTSGFEVPFDVNTGHWIGSAYGSSTCIVTSACSMTTEPEAGYGVMTWVSPSFVYGQAGDVFTYEITVMNVGTLVDDYTLEGSDNAGWGNITLSPEELTGVEPNESRTATLGITAPPGADPGDMTTITVTASGSESSSVKTSAHVAESPVTPVQGEWTFVQASPRVLNYSMCVEGADEFIYILNASQSGADEYGRGYYFMRYNTSTGYWEDLQLPPSGFKSNGHQMCWNGSNYLYAVSGGSYNDAAAQSRHEFWRYNITNNSWETLPDTPFWQGPGDALTWVELGTDEYIYAVLGSSSSAVGYPGSYTPTNVQFWRFDVADNTWDQRLYDIPYGADDGTNLVWTYGDYIYALPGAYTESLPKEDERYFVRYSISENTWVEMEKVPYNAAGGVDDGGSLVYLGGDYIYALKGGNDPPGGSVPGKNFWCYSISGGSWAILPDIPEGIGEMGGCRMGYADGNLYYWVGPNNAYTVPERNLYVYGLVEIEVPTVTTNAATGVTTTQATLNASFTIGSYSSVDVWFQYRVQGEGTWTETTPATKTASGSHSANATSLTSGENYEFRGALQYDTENIYGSVLTFTTAEVGAPTVTTNAATGIAITQATLNASFTLGDYSSVDVWFQYRVQDDGDWTDNTAPTTYTAPDNHADNVTGLTSGENYEFRACLQYDTENIYGDTLTFTTEEEEIGAPTVTTNAATGIAITQATLNASFTLGDYSSVDVWFQYRVEDGGDWTDNTAPTTYTAPDNHADNVTGLTSDENYEFRAALQYDTENIYGSTLTFTTVEEGVPTVTTSAATGVTTTQATLNASFTIGGYDNVDVWFQYRVQDDGDWTETTHTTKTASGSHSANATGLTSDENYEFRACLQYDTENIYGSTLTFTTVTTVEYGVQVSISPGDQARLPGDELTYTVTVSNTGEAQDTYSLGVTDNASPSWTLSIDPGSLTIAAGASKTATLSVTIPDDADNGDVDLITVTATSATDSTISDSATCTATVVFEYEVLILFIPSGENRVANFENENIPVFKVTIFVENAENDTDGTVTVTVLKTVEVSVPPGMVVHRYLNIETSIKHANRKGLLAKFRVSKSWVVQNDIDEGTIKVLKFDNVENEWRVVADETVDTDENYLYFEASLEGLSLFAITGETKGGAGDVPILLIALAVVAASAGGVGAAIVWYRPELPSLPRLGIRRRRMRPPRFEPKVQVQRRLPEGVIEDIDKWVKAGKFRSRRDAKVLIYPKAAVLDIDEKLKQLRGRPKRGKRLPYSNFWSLGVGNYRVIYEVRRGGKEVVVLFIGHRERVSDDFSKLLED